MNMSLMTTILKKTWQEYGRNKISRLGAALSYYTFASFFPLLLVLIALVGMAVNLGIGADAESSVIEMVAKELPAAQAVLDANLRQLKESSGTIGLIGLLTGLWAASNIFAQLQEAFDVIYGVGERKQTWKDQVKSRAQAALIVVLIAVLMVSSLVFSTFLNTATSYVGQLPGGGYWIWLLNLALSLGLTALVFASLFKYIPNKLVTWKAALVGGLFTSMTWQIGRELITWWLGRSAGPTAGTVVGSVLAFLVLIYYAAQILMLGAQLTATYDEVINPELVRDPTLDDQALHEASPDKMPAANIGMTAPYKIADFEPKNASGFGAIPISSMAASPAPTAHSNFASFAAGYLAGLGALLVGLRMLLGKVLDQKS